MPEGAVYIILSLIIAQNEFSRNLLTPVISVLFEEMPENLLPVDDVGRI